MINIIPMSGSGSRFSEEGYVLPKPLIFVSGQPMIYAVIEALPSAEKWIFIVRKEHIDLYEIDKVILKKIPEAIIISEEKPKGQATSCLLALPYIDSEKDILIASCDNSFLYNEEKFIELKKRKDVDMIVWTFTKNEILLKNPNAWGWANLDSDGETIVNMSVKVPISTNPFSDHAVVATFYFKKIQQFKEACELMMREKYEIKNEYYVDSLPIFYKKLNLKSVIFDVDLYVSWGKPADLHIYEEKEYLYQYGNLLKNENNLWVEFFKKINKNV